MTATITIPVWALWALGLTVGGAVLLFAAIGIWFVLQKPWKWFSR